jgi:hypothetical protein
MKYYQEQGWTTHNGEKTGRFTKYKDIFSQWFEEQGHDAGYDLVAAHKEKGVLFIQVTTSKPKGHKPFLHFANNFPGINTQQYVRIKRERGENSRRIFTYRQGGYVEG